MQKVPPGHDVTCFEINLWPVIDTSHPAGLEILQYLGPDTLHLAGYNCVDMAKGLLGKHGSVDTTHHDGNAPVPICVSYFISPADIAREGGNADKISLFMIPGVKILVQNPDIPISGSNCSHIGKSEGGEAGYPAQHVTASAPYRVDQQ